MTNLTDPDLNTALKAVFETAAGHHASWIALPGGSVLFTKGEAADHLYLVKSGRLGVFHHNNAEPGLRLTGVIRPGEPAGEMALIAGTPHTATVAALRDTELLTLPRDRFFEAIAKVPDVLLALSRKMIHRARDVTHNTLPDVFGFFALDGCVIAPLVSQIAQAIAELGFSVRVLDKSSLSQAQSVFSQIEGETDYVLMICTAPDDAWARLTLRQADHVFMAVNDTAKPLDLHFEGHASVWLSRPDLLIFHDNAVVDAGRIEGTGAILEALDPERWFHLARGRYSDAQRLARIMTGTSIGLVCSGGGARAYAHIGAIQALREAHVPLDFCCGASMGAIISACVGLDWTDQEIEAHIREAFVVSSPLDDIAFPLIAMTSGRKVDQRLKTHFGNIQIEDMPLPFFCVSSNLTTGQLHIHRTGLLREALRASISLPGVLPPVVSDGNVLVDGAVMRSFPTDLMRTQHLGSVVGIDVTRAIGLGPDSIMAPSNLPGWLASGGWRSGPPIVSILMRSATISTTAEVTHSRQATDFLIIPEPDGVEIRDWHAYDQAVHCGYNTAIQALNQIEMPVIQLRRSGAHFHPPIPAFTPDMTAPRKTSLPRGTNSQ